MCVCVCIFIYSPIDGHLGCFHTLAIVNAAMNVGGHISYLIELVFSFSLGEYPEVKLLDHMATLFLIF